MRTAIDTNVISALWSGEPTAGRAVSLLTRCLGDGGLVICGTVYAELLAHPRATSQFVDGFLRDTNIAPEFAMDEVAWRLAGERFAEYAGRRRESGGKSPKRLLADFLVGAHAERRADRLLTFDRDRYGVSFPALRMEG